jgi:hypothetical protein
MLCSCILGLPRTACTFLSESFASRVTAQRSGDCIVGPGCGIVCHTGCDTMLFTSVRRARGVRGQTVVANEQVIGQFRVKGQVTTQ